jgi:hypothetical protein
VTIGGSELSHWTAPQKHLPVIFMALSMHDLRCARSRELAEYRTVD